MCLDKFNNNLKQHPNYKNGFGWKVFRHDHMGSNGHLTFAAMAYHDSKRVPINQWLESTKSTGSGSGIPFNYSNGKRNYVPHFHIYLDRPDWTDLGVNTIMPVQFRFPTTTGIQSGKRIVIAKQMFVPTNPRNFLKKYKVYATKEKRAR